MARSSLFSDLLYEAVQYKLFHCAIPLFDARPVPVWRVSQCALADCVQHAEVDAIAEQHTIEEEIYCCLTLNLRRIDEITNM